MSTWKSFPSVIVAGFKRRLLIGLTAATAAVCALAHADPLPLYCRALAALAPWLSR